MPFGYESCGRFLPKQVLVGALGALPKDELIALTDFDLLTMIRYSGLVGCLRM